MERQMNESESKMTGSSSSYLLITFSLSLSLYFECWGIKTEEQTYRWRVKKRITIFWWCKKFESGKKENNRNEIDTFRVPSLPPSFSHSSMTNPCGDRIAQSSSYPSTAMHTFLDVQLRLLTESIILFPSHHPLTLRMEIETELCTSQSKMTVKVCCNCHRWRVLTPKGFESRCNYNLQIAQSESDGGVKMFVLVVFPFFFFLLCDQWKYWKCSSLNLHFLPVFCISSPLYTRNGWMNEWSMITPFKAYTCYSSFVLRQLKFLPLFSQRNLLIVLMSSRIGNCIDGKKFTLIFRFASL